MNNINRKKLMADWVKKADKVPFAERMLAEDVMYKTIVEYTQLYDESKKSGSNHNIWDLFILAITVVNNRDIKPVLEKK